MTGHAGGGHLFWSASVAMLPPPHTGWSWVQTTMITQTHRQLITNRRRAANMRHQNNQPLNWGVTDVITIRYLSAWWCYRRYRLYFTIVIGGGIRWRKCAFSVTFQSISNAMKALSINEFTIYSVLCCNPNRMSVATHPGAINSVSGPNRRQYWGWTHLSAGLPFCQCISHEISGNHCHKEENPVFLASIFSSTELLLCTAGGVLDRQHSWQL